MTSPIVQIDANSKCYKHDESSLIAALKDLPKQDMDKAVFDTNFERMSDHQVYPWFEDSETGSLVTRHPALNLRPQFFETIVPDFEAPIERLDYDYEVHEYKSSNRAVFKPGYDVKNKYLHDHFYVTRENGDWTELSITYELNGFVMSGDISVIRCYNKQTNTTTNFTDETV